MARRRVSTRTPTTPAITAPDRLQPNRGQLSERARRLSARTTTPSPARSGSPVDDPLEDEAPSGDVSWAVLSPVASNSTGVASSLTTPAASNNAQGTLTMMAKIDIIQEITLDNCTRTRNQKELARINGNQTGSMFGYLNVFSKKKFERRRMVLSGVYPADIRYTKPAEALTDQEFMALIGQHFDRATADQTDQSNTTKVLKMVGGCPLTFPNYDAIEKKAVELDIFLENLRPALTAGEEREIVKSAFKQLREENAIKSAPSFLESKRILDKLQAKIPPLTTLEQMHNDLLILLARNRAHYQQGVEFGIVGKNTNASEGGKRDRDDTDEQANSKRQKTKGHKPQSDAAKKPLCAGCGRNNHTFDACLFRKQQHPDANNNGRIAWAVSKQGKEWQEKGQAMLPGTRTLAGAPFKFSWDPKEGDNAAPKRGTTTPHVYPIFSLTSVDLTGYTLTMGIYSHVNSTKSRQVNTLIDTGALKANFVSADIAAWLTSHGALKEQVEGRRRCLVCSVNECMMADTIISFTLEYLNETINKLETLNVNAWVLSNLPCDVIIGRPTIEEERLLTDRKIPLSGTQYTFHYKTKLETKTLLFSGSTPHCGECQHKNTEQKSVSQQQKCCDPKLENHHKNYCECCTPENDSQQKEVIPLCATRPSLTKMSYSIGQDALGPLTFTDPKVLQKKEGEARKLRLKRNRMRQGPVFTAQGAEDTYKGLQKVAAEQINETLTTLGRELRDGKLRGATPLSELAIPAGPSDTVTAPLSYLYFLNDVDRDFLETEFECDTKHTIAQYLYLIHGQRVSKDELLDPIVDDDTIDYSGDNLPWEQQSTPDTEPKPFQFAPDADAAQKQGVLDLLHRYDGQLQATLNTQPADLEPMVLRVDDVKWKVPRNRAPARFMSDLKRVEIKNQVEKMLDLGLIRPSQGAEKSQVVLAKKPDGSWRFCIDYRARNEQTESMGWPIPNIPQMLQRIGMKKARFFAVMDLTMGFYQAPLHKDSRRYTTFSTWMGTYEWQRVAMGLKGAPSWFQQQLETKVLAGLIHNICEIYIDDIIVFADTYEEYLANIEAVLARFKQYNITVSPKKCKFLMSSIEYVGHIINHEGITFSQEAKQKTLDFAIPTTTGQLKQFVGMAEYFHSHVRHFAKLARPLHQLLHGYTKRTATAKLHMSEEDIASFKSLQSAIDNCQQLHFPVPNREIFLETDASDYGIGAYLYQKDTDGKQYPIAFISKNLAGAQLNWSVPEKEAFGIFYALQRLEHLLRDVHFVLKTDHKNLTYINFGNSAKIMRWKLMIQEYDFDIEHVAGEDNVVADALSRLMAMPKDHEVLHLLAHANVLTHVPKDKHEILAEIHNTNVGHFGITATLKRF